MVEIGAPVKNAVIAQHEKLQNGIHFLVGGLLQMMSNPRNSDLF